MSCAPSSGQIHQALPSTAVGWLGFEGFRLFFSLSALHLALWPFVWVVAFGLDLPLAGAMPASLWHGYEMLAGGFGAALIGFLTTAAPEWTDTTPLRGRPLWLLALAWGVGRVIGLTGLEGAVLIGAVADLGWLGVLILYLLRLSWQRRTDRLLAFVFWLAVLAAAVIRNRWALVTGDVGMAVQTVHLTGFALLGMLGLALARISVPVTNLVLDPSETTSPFRPHPGRLHLAPGLVLVAMAGDMAGLSDAVSGWLWIAAGAAFMDRVGEAFVGRAAVRTEILLLSGSAALAGLGLLVLGAARLGAPWGDVEGLHIAFMGGLGLGVLAVFSIAGRLHAGLPLRMPFAVRVAALFLILSLCLRIDMADLTGLAGFPNNLALASALWALGSLLWLGSYIRIFLRPPI